MTALVHMGDEDLKALGVPMVNLQEHDLISFQAFSIIIIIVCIVCFQPSYIFTCVLE